MSRKSYLANLIIAILGFIVLGLHSTAEAGQAVVSDVDGVLTLGNDGIFSGVYDFQSGLSANRPWYAVDVASGEKMTIRLFTDFPSTFLLYEVFDGNVQPGDTPFGANPDLQFLSEADFPGTAFPRIFDFPISHSTQLLVQIDSPNGSSGRYGLQFTRTLAAPEPASVVSATLTTTIASMFSRPRRRLRH